MVIPRTAAPSAEKRPATGQDLHYGQRDLDDVNLAGMLDVPQDAIAVSPRHADLGPGGTLSAVRIASHPSLAVPTALILLGDPCAPLTALTAAGAVRVDRVGGQGWA